MNIFEKQLDLRSRLDEEMKENAYFDLASGISDLGDGSEERERRYDPTDIAVAACLKYYGVKVGEVPDEDLTREERLYYLCRKSDTMHRQVKLSGEWYKTCSGPMIGSLKTGEVIALIPSGFNRYRYFEPVSGKRVRVGKAEAETIAEEAVAFYRAFPAHSLTVSDLIKFMISSLDAGDFVAVILATLAATLVGLMPAWANAIAFGIVIPEGVLTLVGPIAALLAGAYISTHLITACRNFVTDGISVKMGIYTEAAAYSRLLYLPSSFFRRFNAGDLAVRIVGIKGLSELMSQVYLECGLTTLMCLIYLIQIAYYAPSLTLPAFLTFLAQIALIAASAIFSIEYENKKMNANAELSGVVTSILGGIQKIKLSGAENRAFAKWAKNYSEYARPTYNRPRILQALPALVAVAGLAGYIFIYHIAAYNGVKTVAYMAFNAAYGQMNAAIVVAVALIGNMIQIYPMIDLIKPILAEEPERSSDMPLVGEISGGIDISNVSFRYGEKGDYILKDISLSVRAGEYVAIVGRSGSGKTTLARLLLGFEKPEKGRIFYDRYDVSKVDVQSLRRRIGSVMQNGKLFIGNIFYNIIVSAPGANIDDAWAAAEIAGVAEDIRNMPMGMQTLISENGSGLSGGQRQRLLIARAVCAHPKILIFDEATSALDNVTQKQVSDSLEGMNCTRIVIAHRLSTIKNCKRIICIDKGEIVEEGSYEELMEKDGYFAHLVRAQQI